MHYRKMAATVAAALIVSLTACEQRDVVQDDATDQPSPVAQPGADAGTDPMAPVPGDGTGADAEDPDPSFAGTTEPQSADPASGSIVVLDDVRSSRRNGYDRVVFEFRGEERPGWQLRYEEPPFRHCASDQVIDVSGNAFLALSMSPTVGYVDEDGQRRQTVQDRDRRPQLPQVEHIRETCDHHGGVTWVIGLRSERAYRVLELDGPARLVIDIRNDGQ